MAQFELFKEYVRDNYKGLEAEEVLNHFAQSGDYPQSFLDSIEQPKVDRNYELQPKEDVFCKISGCYCSSIKDKNSCNYHACPYSNDGDDGYF
jgi:hypothetical protein